MLQTLAVLLLFVASSSIAAQQLSITSPVDQLDILPGEDVTFSVTLTHTSNVLYSFSFWNKDDVQLSDEKDSTLTIQSVDKSDAGEYFVTVVWIFSDGTTTIMNSSTALLTILETPVIALQPESRPYVTMETDVMFSVMAVGGSLSYQWQKNGVNISDTFNTYSGTKSNTLTVSNVTDLDRGSYRVSVSNPIGAVTSNQVNLTILTAPIVTTQPLHQMNVPEGLDVTFSVSVTGFMLVYQWQKDGINISDTAETYSGTNMTTLMVLSVTEPDDTGNYIVIVYNNAGSAESDPAVLTVLAPPIIDVQPMNDCVPIGVTAVFSVEAVGDLQWFKVTADGDDIVLEDADEIISGATTATLSVLEVSSANIFYVVVSNAAGSVQSDQANIILLSVPVIDTKVSNLTNEIPGSDVMFTVVASVECGNLSYQWLMEANELTDGAKYSGVTTDTLTVLNIVHPNDEGMYFVLVTNAAGTISSDAALLDIVEPPSITTQPSHQLMVLPGYDVIFSVTASGDSLSYQWRMGSVVISDEFGVYNGTATDTLTLFNVQEPEDEGVYTVVVSNDADSVTSDEATLEIVNCDALVPPINSSITYSNNSILDYGGFSIGANATYSCTTGQLFIGDTTRICLHTGEWGGEEPQCLDYCSPLTIDNGTVIYYPANRSKDQNLPLGATANFACDPGYSFMGIERTCMASDDGSGMGNWSEQDAVCQSTCPPLIAPADGDISYDPAALPNGEYSVGVVATFSCDNNFDLFGPATKTCLDDHTWDNSDPTCEATCPPLTAPADGGISYGVPAALPNGEYGVGTVATFSCDNNFDLFGSATRTCLGNHTWDNSNSICRATCPPLTAPADGGISYDQASLANGEYGVGVVATLSCDHNFDLSGSSTRTCLGNHTWDNSDSTCQATCPSLTAPTNGGISYDQASLVNGEYGVGVVATFFCDNNFDLSGSATRTCLGNHTWDNSNSTCQATCPPLTAPADGDISYDVPAALPNGEYGVGVVATFFCDNNFDLSGSATRMCLGNHTWDNSDSRCQATCPPLTAPADGGISYDVPVALPNGEYGVGVVATFFCDNNFDLSGSATRTCLGNHTWDNSDSTCQATCPPLTAPADGDISYDVPAALPNGEYGVGVVATFFCDNNFDLSGSATRTCLGNHTWDNSDSTCQTTCPLLTSPADGGISYDVPVALPNGEYGVGVVATFFCDNNFDLSGSATRTCLGNHTWDNSDSTCQATCPPLTAPADGGISYDQASLANGEYGVGVVATFSCDNNFDLSGSATRTCLGNHTWDNSDSTCQVTCPPLTAPADGGISYDQAALPNGEYGVGVRATFSCDNNFDLSGSATRTCLENHAWDNSDSTCQATCPPLTSPADGDISYDPAALPNGEYGVGAVATFSCDNNFDLSGSATRTCLGNHTWDNSDSTCQVAACLGLNLQNGIVQYSNDTQAEPFDEGTEAQFSCNEGYSLLNDSTLVCVNISGLLTWSNDPSICQRITCDPPILDHGMIRYTAGTTAPYDYGTIATFSCNDGFALVGSTARTCSGSGQSVKGVWNESIPYCDAGECTFAGNEFPFVNVTTFPNFQTLNKSEDVTSEPITIPDKLVFGDRIVDTAYVNENGAISFDQSWMFSSPKRFPTEIQSIANRLVVAPFWSDNDIRKEGSVKFATYSTEEEGTNPLGAELMANLTRYIRSLGDEVDFEGRWFLVAHWDRVHPSPHGGESTNGIHQSDLDLVNNYQAIIVSGVVRAYAVFSYICGEMQWSSVGANDLAVVGFNAAGPFNGVNDELSFKNYRLSGLPNVGVTISCEYEPVTNLIIRLPSTEAQRRKLECIQQLKRDMDILQGETTYTELADMLTQCPCSRDQCLQDEARFIRQESITDRECYITTNPIEMQIGEQYLTITQQCCYTSNRALYKDPTGSHAGTMLLFHPIKDPDNYNRVDNVLRETCCSNNQGFCERFLQQRIVNNCDNFQGPKVCSGTGDPHFWTMDRVYHTFNGRGDFITMEIESEDGTEMEFALQARMANVRFWRVTTHHGIAFGNEKLAFHFGMPPDGFKVYQTRPGPTEDITDQLQNGQPWLHSSKDALLTRNGNTLKALMFEAGIAVEGSVNLFYSGDYYMNVRMKVPPTYGSRPRGFYGSPDGNNRNELYARNATSPILPPYSDRQLYPYLLTWKVRDEESLFYVPEVPTTLPPVTFDALTDMPSSTEPPTEEEWVPVFVDDLDFTPEQKMVCGENLQCLFDLNVTGEMDIAMETLNHGQETEETRDTIDNFPPNITAERILRVNLGEESVLLISVIDPGDNFTLSLEGGVPENATLEELGIGEYGFRWTLHHITDRVLEFVATDTRGASSTFMPRVELCSCVNGGECTLNGVVSDSATITMNCLCLEAYTGGFCQEDRDGCTEIQCFEGVECIDVPAPGVGAECGPCPDGFTGNSRKCYDIDECAQNSTICSQICINTRGNYFCSCYNGFQLIEGTNQCEDVDECNDINDCQQICENNEGSYVCSCKAGFTLSEDNSTCNADEPCAGECSFGCAVVNGSEQCFCPTGYELALSNKTECVDIDECASANAPCDQLCNNTGGSFHCECNRGYSLADNERTCEDVDECFEAALRDEEVCGRNGQCLNKEGSFECACVTGFVWMNEACQRISCDKLGLNNGVILYTPDSATPYVTGTIATHKCAEGFALIGESMRTCELTNVTQGRWSGLAPTCDRIVCPVLTSIGNGSISYVDDADSRSPYDFGSIANYYCHSLFHLVGDAIRVCGNGEGLIGEWNGTDPTCEPILCYEQLTLNNGCIDFFNFNYGYYYRQCVPGYERPPAHKLNSIAIHYCNDGYFRDGISFRNCDDVGNGLIGEWDGVPPTCQPLFCPELNLINGMIEYIGDEDDQAPYNFSTLAIHNCNEGYALVGHAERNCSYSVGSNGRWDGLSPTCDPIFCDALELINGQVSYLNDTGPPFEFNTLASLSCNEGYSLIGSEFTICRGNGNSTVGEWSGNNTFCHIDSMCPHIPDPRYGQIYFTEDNVAPFEENTKATYSCDLGYGLVGGDSLRTCEMNESNVNGVWSGEAPSCGAIMCSGLLDSAKGSNIKYNVNASISGDYPFGTRATYTCIKGFALVGDTARVCSGNDSSASGYFDGAPPTCEEITCVQLKAPSNGWIIYNGSLHEDDNLAFNVNAFYSCDFGYALVGQETRRCAGDGSSTTGAFEGASPTCELIMCTDLRDPSNGQIHFTTDDLAPFELGTMAMYSCDPGYGLEGVPTVRKCESDGSSLVGNWTGAAPSCEGIVCAPLVELDNGHIYYNLAAEENGNFLFGTVATYTCSLSYSLVGSSTTTCSGDGNSSIGAFERIDAPTCEAIVCPSLELFNGDIIYSTEFEANATIYTIGTEAIQTCNAGYTLAGSTVRVCEQVNENGMWSGIASFCQPIVEFGLDTMAMYQCDTGFTLVGDVNRTCKISNQTTFWDGMSSYCQLITCGALDTLLDGDIEYTMDNDTLPPFDIGTVAIFSCHDGSVLIGSDQRVCELTDTSADWNEDQPICGSTCSPLDTLASGSVNYTDVPTTNGEYLAGTMATFFCEDGAKLTGDNTSTCQDDHTWTVTNISCEGRIFLPFLDIVANDGAVLKSFDYIGCSDLVFMSSGLPLGSRIETKLRVCSNGVISFGTNHFYFWYPERFPSPYIFIRRTNVLAVFWNDHDPRTDGIVQYKVYSIGQGKHAEQYLSTVSNYVSKQQLKNFTGTWMLVAYWNQVPPYPYGSNYWRNYYSIRDLPQNSYQAIVITDNVDTFSVFIYNCEQMDWTRPPYSYKDAVIGYNLNSEYTNFASIPTFRNHPLSGLSEVNMIACTNKDKGINWSNVVYQIGETNDARQLARAECLRRRNQDIKLFHNLNPTARSNAPCPCSVWQAWGDRRYWYMSWINYYFFYYQVGSEDVQIPYYCWASRFPTSLSNGINLCCYSFSNQNFGALLDSSFGADGSTLLRYHPYWQYSEFVEYDYKFQRSCCRDSDLCEEYTRLRSSDNCDAYRPPRWSLVWGDPHITTLDGRVYTFNGWGEYTLLSIDSGDTSFRLQGRTQPVVNSSATQFSAFAFGVPDTSAVEVYLNESTNKTFIFLNSEEITANVSNVNDTFNSLELTVVRDSESSHTFSFPCGIGLTTRVSSGIMSFVLTVPEELNGTTEGLVGNFNGNITDDFTYPNGTVLSDGATDREIHELGQAWAINLEESLFNYPNGLNASDFFHPDHTPAFLDEVVNNASKEVLEACGDNVECIFDASQTGDIGIGLETMEVDTENQMDQAITGNNPPRIAGPTTLLVNLGEVAEIRLNVTDDRNIFNISVIGGLPRNATLSQSDEKSTEFTFKWFSDDIVNISLTFEAKDDFEAISVHNVQVQLCACENSGNCTTDGLLIVTGNTLVLNCECPEAWEGEFCTEDVDGCTEIQCFEGVECIDVPAPGVGAECGPCPDGFVKDGEKCQDLDECLNGTNSCQQVCINTEGSYKCDCKTGYSLSNTTHCEDIDECSMLNGNCHHTCTNTGGAFYCNCREGFVLTNNNRTCQALAVFSCDNSTNCTQNCIRLFGVDQCSCDTGYKLDTDNVTCLDTDECLQNPCGQVCINFYGGFECSCTEGYLLGPNRMLCNDINECVQAALAGTDVCHSSMICVNLVGHYRCDCPGGTLLVDGTCLEPELVTTAIPTTSSTTRPTTDVLSETTTKPTTVRTTEATTATEKTIGPTTAQTTAATTGPTTAQTTEATSGPTTAQTTAATTGPTTTPTTAATTGPTTAQSTAATTGPTTVQTTAATTGPTTAQTIAATTGPTAAQITEATTGPTAAQTTAATTGPTTAQTTAATTGPTTAQTTAATTGPTTVHTTAATTGPTTAQTTAATTGPTTAQTTAATTGPTTAQTTAATTGPTTAQTTAATTGPTTAQTTAATTGPTTAQSTAATTGPTTAQTTAATTGPTTAQSTAATTGPTTVQTTAATTGPTTAQSTAATTRPTTAQTTQSMYSSTETNSESTEQISSSPTDLITNRTTGGTTAYETSPTTTVSPEVVVSAVQVSLSQYTADTFDVGAQQIFREATASVINMYCAQSVDKCQRSQEIKRQAGTVTADDIILTDIRDNEQGMVMFTMHVQLEAGLLMATDLQQAIEEGRNIYADTGFSGLSLEVLVTEAPRTTSLTGGQIAGIAVGFLMLTIISIMIFVAVLSYIKYCRHYKKGVDLTSSCVEYQNPLATVKADHSKIQPATVERNEETVIQEEQLIAKDQEIDGKKKVGLECSLLRDQGRINPNYRDAGTVDEDEEFPNLSQLTIESEERN